MIDVLARLLQIYTSISGRCLGVLSPHPQNDSVALLDYFTPISAPQPNEVTASCWLRFSFVGAAWRVILFSRY